MTATIPLARMSDINAAAAASAPMLTAAELAAKLNGVEYGRILKELVSEAKAAGLVIVFSASDDLVEFRGAIRDEVDALGDAIVMIDQAGLLPDRDSIDDDDELERFFSRRKIAAKIKALWCADDEDVSWTYETTIPHATFEMMEDGDVYCRGLVFALADLPAA